MGFASPLVALAALPGAQTQIGGTPAVIVFAPWVTAEDAVSRTLSAGHRVLRSGRFASIVIAAPAPGQALSAARPQGAILLVALGGLAGCLDAVASQAAS
ncbi:hypothetical protein [Bosea sp. (in: a-proteobacteria)]|uniref:hypothetical protein n=1 Tax=Bosea sp. (in: a-proteobacteria) TaxID=1871050 RepID=UPI0027344A8E|nr:hypothetical protein [Bosea sp. (in: a-proteobacteria)]MDP3406953.1 hypothetical protein [Bosea sp. (in: a-proteobacteria)]